MVQTDSQAASSYPNAVKLGLEDSSRNVFVVHGRNLVIRDELFAFLRALDLHPLEWSEAVRLTGQPSPYVGDILDAAFENARAIVVLFTPDDVVHLRKDLWGEEELPIETDPSGQARPNVLFEAGIAMGRSQDQTVLVEVGMVKPFSDIGGRHVIRLGNSTERRQEFAQRLRSAGCPVNMHGTNWHTAGNLDSTIAPLDVGPAYEEIASGESPTSLSEEAVELLVAAASHDSGNLIKVRLMKGIVIKAGRRAFDARGNRRLAAALEGAIRDLAIAGLIEWGSSGEYYLVTREGFDFVDALEAQTS
ncbi:MAG: nucleotide-binding protein [Chloroflexi bacterium]|nr:nucleotide-binding protein [Chloroflexota bacterium]